jgi:hypothetical protein
MLGLVLASEQSLVADPDTPCSLMPCDTLGAALHRLDNTEAESTIQGCLEHRTAC